MNIDLFYYLFVSHWMSWILFFLSSLSLTFCQCSTIMPPLSPQVCFPLFTSTYLLSSWASMSCPSLCLLSPSVLWAHPTLPGVQALSMLQALHTWLFCLVSVLCLSVCLLSCCNIFPYLRFPYPPPFFFSLEAQCWKTFSMSHLHARGSCRHCHSLSSHYTTPASFLLPPLLQRLTCIIEKCYAAKENMATPAVI